MLANTNPKELQSLVDQHVLSILRKCRELSDDTNSFSILSEFAKNSRARASRAIKKRYLSGSST